MKIPFVKILIVAFLVFSVCSGILIYKNLPRSARQNLVSRLARNKYFQTGAKITTDKINVSAGVVPHHLLARNLIDDFFNYISTREKPETIVLLSPDHFNAEHIIGGRFITIQPETQEFYGMKIDDPLISNLASNNNIAFNNSSINLDHGITNLMPFIKKYFPEAKIIPFIISSNSTLKETGQFSDSLNSLTPLKTIVIASVDFSHYLSSSAAKFHDIKSIRTLIDFEKENFEKLEVDSWQSLYIARFFAKLRGKESPNIIGQYQSIDFLEEKEKINQEITSYFSVVFEEKNNQKTKELNGKTILFVGDIMLDRGVEYLMQKNSVLYPFEKISQFLRGIDIIFGNLEGPIVENPPSFPDNSLNFAFSPEVIKGLSFSNFNLLSLANNHTLNMRKGGLEETRNILKKNNIDFVGDPILCGQEFSSEKENIKFLAINKTFPFNCQDEEIVKTIELVKSQNPEKFLIIILHWGEEYQLSSSLLQRNLAHKIIDAGGDLIIGSHSHVVQEIEEYKGKLIFYSLGNFIFDQYFSKETQQGLAVGLEIYPKRLVFRLFPIQSKLAQPFLMKQVEREEFLEKLAQKSSPELFDKIKSAIIEIER